MKKGFEILLLGVTRFKKIMMKLVEASARAFEEVVVDIASETAKKIILGS